MWGLWHARTSLLVSVAGINGAAITIRLRRCPEAAVWAPDGGVDTFLFVTHWIPGQIGATYEASFLYRRSAAGWSPTKLPAPIERFLDAGRNGAVWIEAVPDGACCGWDNASSDRMVLERDGKKTVLFDEFQRYGNKDYDVSFDTPKARLAPSGRMIAFTIDGPAAPVAEIRLADEGRPDPAQLARIRAALADLPAVEVVDPDHPAAAPVARLHHAQLVGWLGDAEILIAEDGRLVAVDVSSKRRRESGIHVCSARDAFVVSPR